MIPVGYTMLRSRTIWHNLIISGNIWPYLIQSGSLWARDPVGQLQTCHQALQSEAPSKGSASHTQKHAQLQIDLPSCEVGNTTAARSSFWAPQRLTAAGSPVRRVCVTRHMLQTEANPDSQASPSSLTSTFHATTSKTSSNSQFNSHCDQDFQVRLNLRLWRLLVVPPKQAAVTKRPRLGYRKHVPHTFWYCTSL